MSLPVVLTEGLTCKERGAGGSGVWGPKNVMIALFAHCRPGAQEARLITQKVSQEEGKGWEVAGNQVDDCGNCKK